MFLLVWSRKQEPNNLSDHWIACDDYMSALEHYQTLLEDAEVYSASICTPLTSTEAHFVEDDLHE